MIYDRLWFSILRTGKASEAGSNNRATELHMAEQWMDILAKLQTPINLSFFRNCTKD
jgi:hypothetical protein